MSKTNLLPEITKEIETFDFELIAPERKLLLQPLIDYIQQKVRNKEKIRLNFICTHNSRRSHLSQVWAQTAAAYYQIESVSCYSGGTEATALYPVIASTLNQVGFKISQLCEGNNPVYSIKYSENEPPIIGFSKTYQSDFNPKNEFAAVLTCTSADEGCPFITGAEQRISLPFEDPKEFDNSTLQKEKYYERSRQIATELFYVFSEIKKGTN